jgi:hypothetical protein
MAIVLDAREGWFKTDGEIRRTAVAALSWSA